MNHNCEIIISKINQKYICLFVSTDLDRLLDAFAVYLCLHQFHNEWARTSGDLSGSTAILSTFQDGILVMAGVGDSGEKCCFGLYCVVVVVCYMQKLYPFVQTLSLRDSFDRS